MKLTFLSCTSFALILLTCIACNADSNTGSAGSGYQTILVFDSEGKAQLPPGEAYKSPIFEIGEAPARLAYEYETDAPTVGGVFAVFVVPEGGSSLDGDGMPQIISNAVSEKSTEPIQFLGPGRYFLEVTAIGKWKIEVQTQQ